MTIRYNTLTNFINVYDLGNAHGRQIYTDGAQFKKDMLAIVEATKTGPRFFLAVTIPEQRKEKKWLEELGFTSTPITTRHVQHHATAEAILKSQETFLREIEEAERRDREAREAISKARKVTLADLQATGRIRADGRRLRNDGFVVRRPYEYFVGDRVEFIERGVTKNGLVRRIVGTGADTVLHLRTKFIGVLAVQNIITRAQ